MSPPSATRQLSTADERRETVLATAMAVFAARGVHGTRTLDVARAAGISQAYLFRLFPTKEALAVAVVQRAHERILAAFTDAAREARAAGEPVLPAMGGAYVELLRDRDLLLVQLHAQAASYDMPAIREATRAGFALLVDAVERESGETAEELHRFFAKGMLLNVTAAIGAEEVDARWREVLVGDALAPASPPPHR